jgi:hypothetical protein
MAWLTKGGREGGHQAQLAVAVRAFGAALLWQFLIHEVAHCQSGMCAGEG